ncbi:electron transport complex subunit RsxG [Sulfuriferula sp. AH1]|uniref:electron transport complex subunit RsxG n=1 Tax=Sulfuriferula sp. AH1 TaxID=1985873 RepID=UPI000B3BA41B|nr:electron transport complex subunit RsxG [Sulfuriferula sp. AH1]ARU31324.1 electron transport complex subunit RsxG [Sulfuriferula sp. AH1]
MKTMARTASRAAGILLAFTVVFTGILAFTYSITHQGIQHNEDNARRKLVAETLPPHSFNNDLLSNQITLQADPLLGTEAPSLAWQARQDGAPVAVVLEATAPDGYSGKINLLIGVTLDGKISGVRVVSHKETPGLGDYIELAKSNWIRLFDGKSLENPDDSGWKVKKDGGQFDYMAGATITPRAVIKAVHHALKYIALHREQLFAVNAGTKS